jgi:hypothetical protein
VKVVALLLALGSIASADELPTIESQSPPALRVDAPVRTSLETNKITWLAFALPRRDGAISIDLPSGTQVVGIELTSGATQLWGRLQPVHAAARRASDSTGALVAWQGSTGDEDHLVIRHAGRGCAEADVVVPCDQPERVALALILPAIDRLAIAPALGLVVDGKPAAVAMLAVSPTAARDNPHVDADHSLFVDANDAMPPLLESEDRPRRRDFGKAEIRRAIQIHHPQLQGCYAEAELRGPSLAGTAMLQFVIADGRATRVDVGGDLPAALRACIADQLASWDFPQGDTEVEVNYPIAFRIRR